MRNFILGAASLLIAVVLWLQVATIDSPNREREFNAPLVIQNLPDGLVAVEPPETVRILVTGPIDQMETVDTAAFEAFVDARGMKTGDSVLSVEVRGPTRPGLSAKPVRPSLALSFARVGRITRKVEVQETGLPPRDLIYDGATLSPDTVTLTGPETSLDRVSKVRVVLDLSRIRPRSSFSLGLEAMDAEGKPIPSVRPDPDQIMVTPAVGAAPTSKRVVGNPTIVGQLPVGFRLERYELRPSQIELAGASGDLGGVSSVDTEAISLEGVNKVTVKEVNVVVPSGLRVKGPAVIRVTLVPYTIPAAPGTPEPSPSNP